MPQRPRTHALELFIHFARQATDFSVVEPLGDYALLGFLEALNRLALLVKIARIFDFRFHGLHLVARGSRKLESTLLQRGPFPRKRVIPNRSRDEPLSI